MRELSGSGLLHCGADAVVGYERRRVWEVGRDAGGGDGFALVDAICHFEVEIEELLEEVLPRCDAMGGKNGSVIDLN